MSKDLTRAKEFVQIILSDAELSKKVSAMTKEEAAAFVKELGYEDVSPDDIKEVLSDDLELSDGALDEVSGGDLESFLGTILGIFYGKF